jgi:hypothetical protein
MLSAENVVGRLIEVRATGRLVSADAAQRPGGLRYDRARGGPVMCVDLRRAGVADQNAVAVLIETARSRSEMPERQAILLRPQDAVLAMQVARIVQLTNDTISRTFTSVDEVRAWLGEVLDLQERARLTLFLEAAHDPPR